MLIGNWKMNKLPNDGAKFAKECSALTLLAKEHDIEIGVAPTFIALTAVLSNAPEGLIVSSQNVNEHDHGAYTGEVSASMLREIGVTHAIIGHSERREYEGETSLRCHEKIVALLKEGLVPVYCCGESLATFEAGETSSFVAKQIREAFTGLTASEASKVVIAYEPIWAIGTGKSASAEIAETTIKGIRDVLRNMFGDIAEEIRILYGGSVKPNNIRAYMACPDVDGALVGGASLEIDSYKALLEGMIA